jgi:hypothetical protein
MRVKVEDGDEEPLRVLAIRDHRAFRDQGSFLLHLKIREEYALYLAAESESEEYALPYLAAESESEAEVA